MMNHAAAGYCPVHGLVTGYGIGTVAYCAVLSADAIDTGDTCDAVLRDAAETTAQKGASDERRAD